MGAMYPDSYPKMSATNKHERPVKGLGMDGEIRKDLPKYDTSGKKESISLGVSKKDAVDPKISGKVKK